jgi:hypothetical protein
MASIDEIIAGARLPERTITICLRGDLQAEFEDLERQLSAAEAAGDDTLAGNEQARHLAELIEAVRTQMREHEATFRFRGLPAKEYMDLLAQHPPTDEQREKGQTDANWDTWPTALIAACAADPAMTVEQAGRLSKAVSQRQWDDLWATAFAVNRSEVSVPFSLAASAILAGSEPKPRRPEPGVSASNGSGAGSLAG